MFTEIAIVLVLIAVNGGLAMSELAVVSARPARLRPLAEAGSRGAAATIRLAEDPGRFLSTVQIGITLVGVLSGAFSGATLGLRLSGWLEAQGMDDDLAATLGVGGVVVALTYLSLILGELVPKRLALRNPEGLAIRVAPAMLGLSRVAAPVVWVLDRSGRLVLRLLGQSGSSGARVTDDEVRALLSEAHDEGVIEPQERAMMAGVMRLADRDARALMTPRPEVQMLDIDAPPAETLAALRATPHPRLPVQSRATGEVLGIVTLADAFAVVSRRRPLDLRAILRDVPVISERAEALDVVEILRRTPHHTAFVYDEYGHFQGIVTSGDVFESIVGRFAPDAQAEPAIVERAGGGFLVAGWMPVDEFCERLNLPRDIAGDYDTVAGLVLHQLRRLPQLGESFAAAGWRFEIVDMDDRRIDKVLVQRA